MDGLGRHHVILYGVIYKWNLKKKEKKIVNIIKKKKKSRLTSIENKLVFTKGEREAGKGNTEGIKSYKPLGIK